MLLAPLTLALPAAAQPPNIVLISIDGMRADRAHYEGYPRLTTPNLDALAASGIRLPSSWSGSNESLLSHAVLLSGRYASELARPEYLSYLLPEDALLIQEVLQAVGYETAAFIGGGHIRESFGFNQGFDAFYEGEDYFGSLYHSVPKALEWLDERSPGAPFFLFLHGYDLHRPYPHGGLFYHPFDPGACSPMDRIFVRRSPSEQTYRGTIYADFHLSRGLHTNGLQILSPEDYPRLADFAAGEHDPELLYTMSPEDLAHIDEHYDASLLAADTYVGLFIEGLVRAGLWEDTLVVVTSDHGEDMQDHGYYNHRAVLFDATTRVPMILAGGAVPEALRGAVRPDMVSAVDIAPTLAELAGTVPPADARGRSLAPLLRGEDPKPVTYTFQEGVLGQLSARSERWRLVFQAEALDDPELLEDLITQPIDGGRFQLFDTYRDTDEQRDVLAEDPRRAEAMREAMVRWRAGIARGTASRPLSPEQRRMLQERGYW